MNPDELSARLRERRVTTEQLLTATIHQLLTEVERRNRIGMD